MIQVRDDDHAKELAERLAILKEYASEEAAITKALKEWCSLDTNIHIYHDGKKMVWGASKAEGKYPQKDLRNSWTAPAKNNLKIFQLLINNNVGSVSAWSCFRANKRDLQTAQKIINRPEFNAALAELVDFDTAPRFGFKTVEEGENEAETKEG